MAAAALRTVPPTAITESTGDVTVTLPTPARTPGGSAGGHSPSSPLHAPRTNARTTGAPPGGPRAAIEGRYPYLLAVRDLAAGYPADPPPRCAAPDGAGPARIRVVPNGVKHIATTAPPVARPESRKRMRVGFVGRVVPIKDLITLRRLVGLYPTGHPLIDLAGRPGLPRLVGSSNFLGRWLAREAAWVDDLREPLAPEPADPPAGAPVRGPLGSRGPPTEADQQHGKMNQTASRSDRAFIGNAAEAESLLSGHLQQARSNDGQGNDQEESQDRPERNVGFGDRDDMLVENLPDQRPPYHQSAPHVDADQFDSHPQPDDQDEEPHQAAKRSDGAAVCTANDQRQPKASTRGPPAGVPP